MNHALLLTLHLLAAIAFAGTVFFEVLVLQGAQARLPPAMRSEIGRALDTRAVAVMPWVLLVLYAAGIGMAWQYRAALAHPLDSRFGLLLSVKIVLAASVLGHFALAMSWRRRGLLHGTRSRRLHRSVLGHVLAIVVLAKALYFPLG